VRMVPRLLNQRLAVYTIIRCPATPIGLATVQRRIAWMKIPRWPVLNRGVVCKVPRLISAAVPATSVCTLGKLSLVRLTLSAPPVVIASLPSRLPKLTRKLENYRGAGMNGAVTLRYAHFAPDHLEDALTNNPLLILGGETSAKSGDKMAAEDPTG